MRKLFCDICSRPVKHQELGAGSSISISGKVKDEDKYCKTESFDLCDEHFRLGLSALKSVLPIKIG